MKPPPLPDACRLITNADLALLRAARPRLWLDPRKSCLTCLKADGSTYRWYADGTRAEIATYECNCRDQWLLHLWLLNAGIGLNYQRLSWDDVATVPAHVVEQIQEYALHAATAVSSGQSLVLWSTGSGTGKTLMLMLLCKALMAQGYEAYASLFTDIIDLFTSSWRVPAEREQWNRRVRNAQILAIDDLGKENGGRIQIVEDALDQVIRTRVANDAPTAITTNLTPEQVQQGYGGYIMSLLSEKATFIEVPGVNFRARRLVLAQKESQLGLSRPITVV